MDKLTPLIKRDSHDRGVRRPLLPHSAPNYQNPNEIFDRLLSEGVEDISIRLGNELENIEISLEQIPNFRDLTLAQDTVPLGRVEKTNPIKVVVYQKPIELRCQNNFQLDRLIRDTLAELIGLATGIRPKDIDPDYQGDN